MVDNGPTRRGFVSGLAATLAAIPFVGGLIVALRAAATPAHLARPARIPLGRLADVPDDGLLPRPVTYQVRRGPAVESVSEVVFLGREAASKQVFALSSRCTHLGCPVTLEPDDAEAPLHCPCHDARFAADGAVLEGPPNRPLDRLHIEVPDDPEGIIELVLS